MPLLRFSVFDEVEALVLHRPAEFDVAGPIAAQARFGELGHAHVHEFGRDLRRVEFFRVYGLGDENRCR